MRALIFVLPLLCGCSALGGLAGVGAGLQTAESVAKTACAILQGTDGSSSAVLAALADLQKQIVEAQAARAAERADPAAVEAMLRALASLADAQRQTALQLGQLAGEHPVRIEPCPATPPTTPVTSGVPLLPSPAASTPLGAAPMSAGAP